MGCSEFKDAFQSGLGVEFGVVLLDAGARDRLQILLLPVNFETTGDALHEAFVSLEDLERTGNPTHGKKGRVGGAESSVGIGQAFPIGEPAGTSDAQGVERSATNRNSVCRLMLVELQRLGDSGGYGVCSLRGVIKTSGSHRSNVRETALDLIGHCQCSEEILATAPGMLACSEHCP